jgi:hypothetical protein
VPSTVNLEEFHKFMDEHMGSLMRQYMDSKQSGGDGANDEDEQIDSSEYEGEC